MRSCTNVAKKVLSVLVSLALAAGLLVAGSATAQAAITWQKVLVQNNSTGTGFPGPPPNGTSVTFTPSTTGTGVEATFSQPHCDSTASCYYTNIDSNAPQDYTAELKFTFDQWVSDVRWNLQAIGKEAGKLPDTSRVFVTTDNGATWEPLDWNGTLSTGIRGNITNINKQAPFDPNSTPAWNVDHDNAPQAGGVSCVWSDMSQGCSTDVQIDVHFPVAINGVKVAATGVPGNGAGANLFNPYVGYDASNPPVPPAPAPTFASISPTSGPAAGGQTVTITGTNFVDGMTATVGGVACSSVNVSSATTLTCVTGAHAAGVVDVALTTTGGTYTQEAVYTYVDSPTISTVSPNTGPVTAGQSITIIGTHFIAGSTVTIGNEICTSVVVVDAQTITCNVPAAPGGNPGAQDVVVTNTGGTATKSNGYTYVAPPTFTGLTPGQGPTTGGQTVTITGTNFVAGNTSVTLGGVNCTPVTVDSATSLTCVTGAHSAGTVDVGITTPGGTYVQEAVYTYVPSPTFTAINPNQGPATGGQTVTITGNDFVAGSTSVTVGGVACSSVSVSSPTTLTCVTGAHAAGAADVAITTPGGTYVQEAVYTYVPSPTFTAINPNKGPVSGGQTVTITGTNFVSGQTTVTVGGVACSSVSVSSPTTLTCVTGAHAAGAADVAITTPGGTYVQEAVYTYVAPPTFTAINPNQGPATGGQSVTISGTNFVAGSTTATVGGVACSSVSVSSPTTLICVTGAHAAGVVDVAISTPGGVYTQEAVYTYVESPSFTGIDPNQGPAVGGQSVTITGTKFVSGQTTVTLGGVTCSSVSVSSPTSLTCVTGSHAAAVVDVAITTAGGTYVQEAVYTYVAAPSVTGISPARGPIAGGQTVTLTGTNFLSGYTNVTVGGVACTSVTVSSATSLTCVTGAHDAGGTDVVVTTPGGSGSQEDAYTYVAEPAITTIAPDMGPITAGQQITIKGSDFTGASGVTVGGVACTSVTVIDDETITCNVPGAPGGNPGEQDVVVTAPGGTATKANGYTYVESPTFTGITPVQGPAVGGQTVTITGTNFVAGNTSVTLGGEDCLSVDVTSPTTLTCVTGAHSAGTVDVEITTPGGNYIQEAVYTYVPAPTVLSVTPNTGPLAGGNQVTITGTNLGQAQVKFGTRSCTQVIVSGDGTSLTCKVPTGVAAGVVSVEVATIGGSATAANAYTYQSVPIIKPKAPTKLRVSGGPKSAKRVVRWNAPANSKGNRPVMYYRIKLNVERCGTFIINKKLNKYTHSYTFTRSYLLKHSKCKRLRGEVTPKILRYRVQVEAVNSKGTSPVAKQRFVVKP